MWYDLVVLAVLVYATVRGAAKGIVWQLAVIAALVLCFVFSGSLSLSLAPFIKVQPPLNRWIAMFILYVGFSFVSFGAARVLRQAIEKAKFEEYDRHLGALFGFAKGVLFCLFLTFFSVTLSAVLREQVMQSYSGYAAAIIMDRLHPVMPQGLSKVLEPYIHELDQAEMELHAHDHDRQPSGNPFQDRAPEFDPSRPAQNGAGADGAPPFSNDAGEFDPRATDGAAGSQDGSVWSVVDAGLEKLLPASFDPELRTLALTALRNTAPADRQELARQLAAAAPSVARQIAQQWLDGRPTSPRPATANTSPVEPAPTSQARAERQKLFDEIAATYVDSPTSRQRFIAEQERLLDGLPPHVEMAVLRDWHADLLSLDLSADPDPQTDYQTDLPTRIVRQLSAARVPLSSLPGDLQSCLRDVRLR